MSVEQKDRTPDGPSRTRGAQLGTPDGTDVAYTSTPGASGLAAGDPAGKPSTAVEREQDVNRRMPGARGRRCSRQTT
jgi:hypothetical protein